jgi:hypothetical protein
MRNKIIILISGIVLLTSSMIAKTSVNTNFCDSSKECEPSCTTNCGTPFKNLRTAIHLRSQGANTARELVGWQWEINRPEMCENYGSAYLAFEYQRSFKNKHIAQALFGTSTLRFAGSNVEDRQPNELLADNFGLAQDFRGSITFNPVIENYILDLGFYMGLDYWAQGLYVRFHAPFVHARWLLDKNCGKCVSIQSGEFNEDGTIKEFPACYVGMDAAPVANSISQALSGNFTFGDMQRPWCAGKFDFARRTRNGLADIDVILGYNVINDDCYHLGLYAQAVLPTGKKRKNLFIFDPVVGNGKHFEMGGGISAHTVLWSGEDSNVALFLEGNVTHLFRSRQCRSFDLIDNGPFSRYMLLKGYDTNGSTFTYNNTLISATCFTNREVDVSIGVKGDASLKLAYRWCGLGFDIGYNIYGHGREKIEVRCNSCPAAIDRQKFAIKGTEPVCCQSYTIALDNKVPTLFPGGTPTAGFIPSLTPPDNCPMLPAVLEITQGPSQANQPNATAFAAGSPRPTGQIAATDCSACFNLGVITEPTTVDSINAGTPENGFLIDNGLQPRLLSVNDLNIHSGQALSVITHKLFMHLCYTWMDECGWNPQVGIGGEVEFDGNHQRSGCERSGLSQWGVWFKGCISF